MKNVIHITSVALTLALALGLAGTSALRGQDAATAASSVVPRLIKFSGVITSQGTENRTSDSASAGVLTATFSLYELQESGAPLWSESQKVQLDERGRYVVLLGATSPGGLPLDLFTSGKALWLGVQPQLSGAGELPRVLLVAVPYALKASDADTLGGKPASAYALAGSQTLAALAGDAALSSASTTTTQPASQAGAAAGNSPSLQPLVACTAVTSDGTATANTVAKFTAACKVENSLMRDNGTGVAVGGTSAPGALLDVQYTSTLTTGSLRGQRVLTTLNPAAASSASAYGIFSEASTLSGNTQNFTGNIFGSDSEVDHYGTGTLATVRGMRGAVVNQAAGTITDAYGITAALSNVSTGTITQGYGVYVNAPTNSGGGTFSNYTGLYIANPTAVVPGAYGLYSPGGTNYFGGNVGIGTTTPGANLEVKGTAKFDGQLVSTVATGTAPLAVTSTTQVAKLNASLLDGFAASAFQPVGSYATLGANTFTGTQTINAGNLALAQTTGPGVGVVTMGGAPFAHAFGIANTFVGGGAGNFGITGSGNTAMGYQALQSNNAGWANTAIGMQALSSNTTGGPNVAVGALALNQNTTGGANTAVGFQAMSSSNGLFDTAVGYQALMANTVGVNMTAVGSSALLSANDYNASGDVALGNSALRSNTTGGGNTATGMLALGANTTGSNNTATGMLALWANTTGSNNTATGFNALASSTTGSNNTVVGYQAGYCPTPTCPSPLPTTGSNSTFVGYNAIPTVDGLTNATAIGAYSNVSASNALVLGGTGAYAVNVGIGTTSPAATLEVNGTAQFDGLITFASGQAFPGTGTVTSVGSGTGLTGGPITTTGSLSIATAGVTDAMLGNPYSGIGSCTGGQVVSGLTRNSAPTCVTAGTVTSVGSGNGLTGGPITTSGTLSIDTTIVPLLATANSFTGSLLVSGLAGGEDAVTGYAGSNGDGMDAYTDSGRGIGGYASTTGDGVYGSSATGYAGNFDGNLNVTGAITAGTKDFKIDHPRDPADRYLYHSSVESSEMMNIYTGNVTLDTKGEGVVELPDWFEALNRDFRYQLTAIGAPAPGLYIAEEIANQRFKIAGGKPGMKVSWQVTGVRQDAYANAHPLQVEVEKPANERGYYIHPELFGAPRERSIEWARNPELMKKLQEAPQRLKEAQERAEALREKAATGPAKHR